MISINKAGNKFCAAPSSKLNAIYANIPTSKYQQSGVWTFAMNRIVATIINDLVKEGQPIQFANNDVAMKVHQLTLHDPDAMKRPIPADFKFKMEPLPVQQAAYDHLWGLLHMCLSCEVGLGKAKMIADIAGMHFHEEAITGAVVVMPPSILFNFKNEMAKHCAVPFDVEVLDYGTKRGVAAYNSLLVKDGRLKVLIVPISRMWTHEKVSKNVYKRGKAVDMTQEFMEFHDSLMAIDESHIIKNPEKVQYINTRYLADFAVCRLIATGTSSGARKTLDIYAQYDFLSPDIVGVNSYGEFRSTFCLFGGFKNRDVIGHMNEQLLMDSIAPYTFVATQKDWLNLPELTQDRFFVDIAAPQKKAIEAVIETRTLEMGRTDLKKWEKEAAIVQASAQIHLISGGHRSEEKIDEKTGEAERVYIPLFKSPGFIPKVQHLELFLDSIGDSQMLLWVHFRCEQEMLYNYLTERGYDVLWIRSGLKPQAKEDAIESFRSGDYQIMLSHQQAAGVGVTINEAKITYFYSSPRDPISRTQAVGRNYRFGQTDGVLHVDVMTRGTYDKKILDALQDNADFDSQLKAAIYHGDADLLY